MSWETVRIFRKTYGGFTHLDEIVNLNNLTNSTWKDFKIIYFIYSIDLDTPNNYVEFELIKLNNSEFKIVIKNGNCTSATFKYICMEDY